MVDGGNYTDIGDVPPVIVASPDGTDVQLPAIIIDSETGVITVGATAPDGTVISTVFTPGVNADGSVTMPTVAEQGSSLQQAAFEAGVNFDSLNLADMFTEDLKSTEAFKYVPLKGASFVNALWLYAEMSDIDPLASAANMMHEGINGKVGDGGHAFGPWQIWAEDGRLPQFNDEKPNSPLVQAWTWSAPGIAYAHRSMATAGASGLTGHAAVDRILNYFERPQERTQNLINRNASYDVLKSKGNNVKAYLASLVGGTALPGVTDAPVAATVVPNQPATAKNAWSEMMSAIQDNWYGTGVDAIRLAGTFNDALR